MCDLELISGSSTPFFTQYLNHTSWNTQLSFLTSSKLRLVAMVLIRTIWECARFSLPLCGLSWLHAKGTKHLRKSPSSLQAGRVEAFNSYGMWLAHLIDWPAHWLSMLGEKPAGGSVCLIFEVVSALTLTALCSHICTRLSKCTYSLQFRIWCKICLAFEAFFFLLAYTFLNVSKPITKSIKLWHLFLMTQTLEEWTHRICYWIYISHK